MAVSPATRHLVRQRANGLCEYCHADERWQFIRFTIDHIHPRSVGGADTPDNLALACRNCNERRSNRTDGPDPDTGANIPFFNPRMDLWPEHFAWSSDKIRIVALSAMGRATLALLDMNDDRHEGMVLRIRQRDCEDGYHPPAGDPVLSP